MKKQRMVLLGSLALVILLSVVLIILMTSPQQEQPQESSQTDQQQEMELLSMTVEKINTISVENPAGGFVLVNQGSGFVVEGYEEVATSSINVNNLTANFTSLQAKRLLLSQEELTLGSSNEQLEQYGLDNPQYSIQIVTTDGNTEELFLGNSAPDGSSIYALYQDAVYLLDDRLLDSVSKGSLSFLDNQITDLEPEYEKAIITLSGTVRSSPVTLEIQTGEFIGLIGHTGSGKSTLMNMLGCLDVPTSGTYLLHDQDVSRMSDDDLSDIRNREIGFIFQGFNLIPNLTALENVELPLIYRGISKKERLELSQDALRKVGLEKRMNHKPSEMSGGQQQRVAIARAIAQAPPVILADEPTGNLDSGSTKEIMGILKSLHQEGRTVIIITHDNDIAAQAERVIRIKDGYIEADYNQDTENYEE